jgi:Predicted membrane protein
MSVSSAHDTEARTSHNKWLLLIASYKTLQAILFALIGLGARHLLHRDVGDELTALADHLRFNPESRLVNFVLGRASLLNDPVLHRIGILAFAYSAISYIEGIGLYFERVWAEYLTLIVTASFLPWELIEIFRRQTWFRFGLLAVNLLVFLYLLKLVCQKVPQRAKPPKTN